MRMTLALVAAVLIGAADDKKTRTVTFSKESLNKVPAGWKADHTGKKGKGSWKVEADDKAPSKKGYVLSQTGTSPRPVFNLCILDKSSQADVEVSVMFRANKGEDDQGGGIVWRYADANNYYVARMNPLEDNFRVYKVVAGKRAKEFQSAKVKVKPGTWHTLKIRMVGDHIQCWLDAKKHLDVKDSTFTKAGKVGLWTKADARTSFDQLVITDLK